MEGLPPLWKNPPLRTNSEVWKPGDISLFIPHSRPAPPQPLPPIHVPAPRVEQWLRFTVNISIQFDRQFDTMDNCLLVVKVRTVAYEYFTGVHCLSSFWHFGASARELLVVYSPDYSILKPTYRAGARLTEPPSLLPPTIGGFEVITAYIKQNDVSLVFQQFQLRL